MKICVKFGEREVIDSETRTWTTSHFTWGEGNEVTDHVLTITKYITKIKIYVDDPKKYTDMNGLTTNDVFHEIPAPSYSYGLSKLTGLCIKSNLLYSPPLAAKRSLIPALEGQLYAYLDSDCGRKDKLCSFYYRKIELTDSLDGMALVREVNAYTQESEEKTY